MNQDVKKLYRSRTNRLIAGVCGGLGEYFEIDPVLVRLVFILSIFFGGFGILLYLILILIVPLEPGEKIKSRREEKVQEFAREIKSRAKTLAEEFREEYKNGHWHTNKKNIIGLIIIIFGLGFLLNNLLPFRIMRWDLLWPLIIIFVGFLIIFQNKIRG